jgi:hypothetical protein
MTDERIGTLAKCVVCGRSKCPRGRDTVDPWLCDMECPGYDQPPLPGDLWDGETAEEFGYPCQTTEERNQ